MIGSLPDISSPEDVKAFVDAFYGKVLEDDLLKPVFVDIAGVDWDEHLPKMYAFWSSLLLGTANYHGAPFPPHFALRQHINTDHFDRWLNLFEETIDSLFAGDRATMAIQRARNIAWIFQAKMGLLQSDDPYGLGAPQ